MNFPITNVRGITIHYSSGDVPKPLCKPDTRVIFHRTLIGRHAKFCEACATLELRSRWEDRERSLEDMTPAQRLAHPN